MAKKITLETLAEQITKIDCKIDTLDQRMERGFAAVAEEIGDIREKMATKEQIIVLHTQVISIETELCDTKRHKLVTRVADLEEKAFGKARG